MNKSFNLHSFEIRKYSIYKVDENLDKSYSNNNLPLSISQEQWFHYPQRSDLSIHFFAFTITKTIIITILWKGTTIDKVNIEPINNNIISLIAKYPAIGFKQLDKDGKIIKRFQVSFNTKDYFDKCYDCVKDDLKLPIKFLKESDDFNTSINSTNNNLITQTRPIESNHNIPIHSYMPQVQKQGAASNNHLDSQVEPPSQSFSTSYNNQRNAFYSQNPSQTQFEFYNAQVKPQFQLPTYCYSQPRAVNGQNSSFFEYQPSQQPLSSHLNQSFLPQQLHPQIPIYQSQIISDKIQYEQINTVNDLQTSECPQNNIVPLNENDQKPANSTNSSFTNKHSEISLYDLKDEKLKQIIIEKLKDKEFINFVLRLDKMIHEKSK